MQLLIANPRKRRKKTGRRTAAQKRAVSRMRAAWRAKFGKRRKKATAARPKRRRLIRNPSRRRRAAATTRKAPTMAKRRRRRALTTRRRAPGGRRGGFVTSDLLFSTGSVVGGFMFTNVAARFVPIPGGAGVQIAVKAAVALGGGYLLNRVFGIKKSTASLFAVGGLAAAAFDAIALMRGGEGVSGYETYLGDYDTLDDYADPDMLDAGGVEGYIGYEGTPAATYSMAG